MKKTTLLFAASLTLTLKVASAGSDGGSLFLDTRELWTCDALDCDACIGLADRQHCSLNN